MVKRRALVMMALCAVTALGCGPGEEESGRLRVDVYGWGPGIDGADTFNQGMPLYDDAINVRVLLTRPGSKEVLELESAPVGNKSVALPELTYGTGLRLDMEIVNSRGEIVASGATPTFDFVEGEEMKALRLMVSPTNAYSPAGSLVLVNGERVVEQSRLDYRTRERGTWLGRVGHAAVPTSTGEVLVVGGADVVPGSAPGSVPNFRSVYNDVQLYDPETGYFTDLAFDDASQDVLPDGGGRLEDARAFHTVTPIGGDRFLVVGGVNTLGDRTLPVTTIELIDLNASAGSKVRPLEASDGSRAVLNVGRGWHTAHYYEANEQVVVIGGLGEPQIGAAIEPLATMELINVGRASVVGETYALSEARTDHDSTKLSDGKIWVIGGRNAAGALASTEFVTLSEVGLQSSPSASMKQARFGFASTVVTDGSGSRVLVVGGYTGTTAATGSYEIGAINPSSGEGVFVNAAPWTLSSARGGHTLVELPQTGDVMVLGGTGGDGVRVSRAERMSFKGLAESVPYDVLSSGVGEARVPRRGATATLMTNGQVLVFGGIGQTTSNGMPLEIGLDNAEIYNPRDPVGGSLFIE